MKQNTRILIKIHDVINGHTLMQWFPEMQKNQKLIGKVLPPLQDIILQKLNNKEEIDQKELFNIAKNLLMS